MNSSDFEKMSSHFSFNSPSDPRSRLFAKSRVYKRRSINRPNLKPDIQAGPGANPFLQAAAYPPVRGSSLPVEGAFNAAEVGFGSNDMIGGLREGVTDEMRNLKIGGDDKPRDAASKLNAKPSFESQGGNRVSSLSADDDVMASKLPEDMIRKLNIEGLDKGPVDKSYPNVKPSANMKEGTKLGGGISGRNLDSELPYKLKEKLNITGSEELGGKNAETSAGPHSLKTDNVNLTMKNNLSSAPGGRSNRSGQWSGVTDNVLSDEVEKKLNLGTESKYSSSSTDPPQFGFAAVPSFAFTTGDNVPKKDDTIFSSRPTDAGAPFVGFTTPASKVSLASGVGVGQKLEFTAKRETANSSKLKKKKGKLRQSTHAHAPLQPLVKEFVTGGSSFVEKPEASDSYSPMDVSPYQEKLVDDRSSREASVTSSESFGLHNESAPTNSQITGFNNPVDEYLVDATQCMEINSDEDHGELNEEPPMKKPCDQSVPAADTESFKTAPDELDSTGDEGVTSSEKTEASCSSNFERKDSGGRVQYGFVAHPEETVGSNFTFSASSSASKGQVSTLKRNTKKKTSNKAGHPSYSVEIPYVSSSSILSFSTAATSPLLSPQLERKSRSPSQHRGKDSRMNAGEDMKPESPTTTAVAASIAAQEACEKWRLRGNQAYASGEMSKAEGHYTQGINCIPRDEMSRSCLRAVMLCYSNRAATRMCLGRMRDALEDCTRATEIDPNFFRVQVRAANCHLALGEIEDALQYYKKCLKAGVDVCADRKIAVEASEGIRKAQRVSECINRSPELLMSRTSQDAERALEVIAEALTISTYSEKLIEMKAHTLFMLQRYREVIQLCEQTLDSAEKNSPSVYPNESLADSDVSEFSKGLQFRLWRCSLILKSYFHMGRLEEGLASLEKQGQQFSIANRSGSSILESSIPLLKTVRELIRLKAAGNEAFQAGKHAEAIEHYTSALSCNAESRPFAAICFCNRAAAYKALGQITDAIADCSLAIALDGNYQKAISRRATLYEMIRDSDQAAADLRRLISVLTKQAEEKTRQGGGYDRSLGCVNDLRQARIHLSEIEEEAKKDVPLDLYLILGIDSTVSVLEIKKAYRKLALRYHPDKVFLSFASLLCTRYPHDISNTILLYYQACQFLAKGDNGDEKLWRGVAEEVHKDVDRLFKMIGEAYAVLSDSVKRAKYDLEEDTRNAMKRRNEASSYRMRRQQQGVWRSHTNSRPRVSESARWTRHK
ncbi:uncharacterized protein LOC116211218 isoform X2 [Punica granatum]|uniref:Uncharacterized protein LOC116211218 isoform X2 n=1 Tax=Punica granatum TaxID=22663 RepID=A0A6P8E880_PUNGR|nr:uncharacterized protein LOC116211218 isoform X2 [Punica granatum]